MKIIDKINASIAAKETFFSFEFFPPRTEEGVENLFERLDRMASYGPTFCDITWGAGGTTADVTLDIATKMQNMTCVETMMHLTCTNMPVEKLDDALRKVQKAGLQNILALRGDPPKGQESFTVVEGGFSCALDLVRYIRKQYKDSFGIAVAGYPEAHPDFINDNAELMRANYEENLAYLKEKIDAGGDFIVTQLFYNVERFIQFVKDCRAIGITCPILPGIMPIMTYGGFKRMTGFCKTDVPAPILAKLEEIKDNEEAVKAFGIDLGVEMCKQLLDAGVPGLHLYTLNLERSAVAILKQLGLIDPDNVPRPLPWRHIPGTSARSKEDVRPIFWSNRPKSYAHRTADWDNYPSGRWGNARSPAYGTLSEYPFMRRHTGSDKRKERAKAAWGQPESVADVQAVFEGYCQGDVAMLPWTEIEALHTESQAIAHQLVALNKAGYLTINSQPQVNGLPSDDRTHGWGGPGGYVYAKAYVEFFVSPEALGPLLTRLDASPSITYMAVNAAGELKSNCADAVNAVTWGVFPAKEVVQPTVVDRVSFLVWKDEAFGLWLSEWGSLYEDAAPSKALLQSIHDTWFLVSVVENDYVKGDLFGVFGLQNGA